MVVVFDFGIIVYRRSPTPFSFVFPTGTFSFGLCSWDVLNLAIDLVLAKGD